LEGNTAASEIYLPIAKRIGTAASLMEISETRGASQQAKNQTQGQQSDYSGHDLIRLPYQRVDRCHVLGKFRNLPCAGESSYFF
jgi:hypothetical protein